MKVLDKDYSHDRLVAAMEFGFWRYLFSPTQFFASGATLLRIFSNKPKISVSIQYNHSYVFEELRKINNLRNRIAHHEPICFATGAPIVDTQYVRERYEIIIRLFQWMDVDEKSLMLGLDHVLAICNEIESISPKSTFPLSLL